MREQFWEEEREMGVVGVDERSVMKSLSESI
jgi:hypothetical protein